MPTTRKKVIKTVYKDEDDSDEGGDFSDSGSEAEITQPSSSDEDFSDHNSEEEFKSQQPKKQTVKVTKSRKANFTKSFLNKITKQSNTQVEEEYEDEIPFSVKDLTEADKLLPSVLNLSESDSSEDESPKVSHKKNITATPSTSKICEPTSDSEINTEYKDVWSHHKPDNSDDIARKAYLELEKHKNKIEETKKSIQSYVIKTNDGKESNIKDLLALGEEECPDKSDYIERFENDDSDAEMEDWEEVKESKGIPKEGLQLIVDVPETFCRKRKKVDIEMMLKRKANRYTKESQVFKHKVHVLCWLGHGNYVSRVLNDQEVMANVLSLLPSKQCYPGDKVDIKYIEQITTWFKDKIILKQDKHENKFKPKAPPLKEILLQQTKNKVFSTKKYIVFAYVSMLRSLGLQCRIMINFVTVPIRPLASELLSVSTKSKDDTNKTNPEVKPNQKSSSVKKCSKKPAKNMKISQLDGSYDLYSSDSENENIMQLDGNDDTKTVRTRKSKIVKSKGTDDQNNEVILNEDHVSPPKKPRRQTRSQVTTAKDDVDINNKAKTSKNDKKSESETANKNSNVKATRKSLSLNRQVKETPSDIKKDTRNGSIKQNAKKKEKDDSNVISKSTSKCAKRKENNIPKIVISKEEKSSVSSKYFDNVDEKNIPSRKRSRTSEPKSEIVNKETKPRTRSVQANVQNTSKYFDNTTKKSPVKKIKTEDNEEDNKRVSHKDLVKSKQKPKNDISNDLIHIMKDRIKEAKVTAKLGVVKGKVKKESDEDSDYLPVESPKRKKSESDDDFKVKKHTPKPKTSSSKKKDRRVLSTDDELPIHKIDVWAEVFVEELEEWISVDVIAGKVHCTGDIYRHATHPVAYVVGWDNNNNIKDLTKKYVPHWNTVTRKQRVDPLWWETAVKPWLGPKTARDIEEDERLDRMQLEAPLPKSIAEYKNHPLYALRRHLLKFEAIYPPDAATLGFVRGEAVYARSCVYVCRSRDTWLKEAKVVRLGEQPYKVVKARPKWDRGKPVVGAWMTNDAHRHPHNQRLYRCATLLYRILAMDPDLHKSHKRLSNKLITDKPLEVFGPWQVQDYEPPTAENGVVPRNAYGNVELFKECMLPKGTVHIKLPGLNRIAKKLNIDCAPAMTGFDFNGGWSHPVYDGFVVCEEFGEIITEAWLKDQEEQERKEVEKLEARVYGNWKKLIKGLLIKERLKVKYGFKEPSTSSTSTKSKGPKLVVKKK